MKTMETPVASSADAKRRLKDAVSIVKPFDNLKSIAPRHAGDSSATTMGATKPPPWSLFTGGSPSSKVHPDRSVIKTKGLFMAAAKARTMAQRARAQTESIRILSEYLASTGGAGVAYTLKRKTKRELTHTSSEMTVNEHGVDAFYSTMMSNDVFLEMCNHTTLKLAHAHAHDLPFRACDFEMKGLWGCMLKPSSHELRAYSAFFTTIYTHTRIHAYTHTRIHAYTHTRIHAYTHTHTPCVHG